MVARLLISILLATLASAQAAVDMAEDPHYSLLLENSQVRVFRASLKAHEQTFVIHKHNFLLVTLNDCDVVMWREGKSDSQSFPLNQGNVRFFFAGQAVGTRNDQATPCESVIVEFLDPAVTTYGYQHDTGTWDYGLNAIPVPVDPHAKFTNTLRLGNVLVSDVQLLPNDSFSPHPQTAAELLLPISSVELRKND